MTPNKQGTEKCPHGLDTYHACGCEIEVGGKGHKESCIGCQTFPQGDTPEKWEKEFDKEFTGDTGYTDFPVFAIKDFIHKLLQEAREAGKKELMDSLFSPLNYKSK